LNEEDFLVTPTFEIALEEMPNEPYDEEDYQEGPIPVGKDCMAYFYKNYDLKYVNDDDEMETIKQIEHFCFITQGMDSKINLLID